MTGNTTKSTRRSFFLHGGAMLGAGVATTAGAATMIGGGRSGSAQLPGRLEDREAIRYLHLTFMSLMQNQAYEAAAELFDERGRLDMSGLLASGRPAIRRALVAQYREQRGAAIHSAYRHNAVQRDDVVTPSEDRLRACATFHAEVEISSPLVTDSTAAQMARLQGQMAEPLGKRPFRRRVCEGARPMEDGRVALFGGVTRIRSATLAA